ncbi:MAG TPA: ABC transporter substrate-binding protein [Acetobacteraceae bacterium]|nr:ABC transporter substrate-binding protein [Acetobacteraceae bacterium]
MKPVLATLLVAALTLTATPSTRAQSGTLVLYTSQPPQDAERTVAAFRQVTPGVDVSFIRDGTTQIMTRLAAEIAAGAPRPDVLLIADAMSMQRLKQEKRLLPYPDAKVQGLPAAAYDPDHTYFGTKFITTGIIFNTKAPPPHSWTDLLAPSAKNQVVPSPLYSGAAAIFMGTLADVPSLGLRYFDQLAGNGAVAVQGNGQVLTQVAGGLKLFGIVVDFMALNAKKAGSPVGFVFPREGVTVVTEPVAILATAHNVPAARAFVDFLLSEAGQRFAASQGYLPMRPDVPPPPGFPSRDEIHLLSPSIDAILGQSQSDLRRFADDFGG